MGDLGAGAGSGDPGPRAHQLLAALTGRDDVSFRPDQLEAVLALVAGRRRVLLVQRTGWGKSAVYFIATKLLRLRGAGPTLLISPLLALMRNQIEAATRMGIRPATINSTNRDDWEAIAAALDRDEIDLLLVSAPRLANEAFQRDVLPAAGGRSGLLVVDEAHCISDWGHDFVPDYRRIVRILDLLPAGVPVLCCTATANDRVVADIVAQLGAGLTALRGPLGRDGLALHVVARHAPAWRLAWLAAHLQELDGCGIIYCLTVRDTERVAAWLRHRGYPVASYSGEVGDDERQRVEQLLLANQVKAVVATSALGMGFDKADVGFVVHYQAPGSAIAYYQQVGRAGRRLDRSMGVLMQGTEDVDIQDWFIKTAFPSRPLTEKLLGVLEESAAFMGLADLERHVNLRRSRLEHALKVLEVEGAVEREGGRYRRTLNPWSYDQPRVDAVTAARRQEQADMASYADSASCRMELLRCLLDDPGPRPCGICDNCTGRVLSTEVDPSLVAEATTFLRSSLVRIEPRKRWPQGMGATIPPDERVMEGRALSEWGDGGWGQLVQRGKQVDHHFADELVEASVALIATWAPAPAPTWITYVPSLRHPDLVADLAERMGRSLGLAVHPAVTQARQTEPQKAMENSAQQLRNVADAFEIATRLPGRSELPAGPVLLVDDVADSRWTLTVIGAGLRRAGAPAVHPFVLASARGG